MPFSNPVMAGKNLERNVMQSPNFVHGVSGWQIDKNGNAEFNSILIPPGSGGATIYIQATAPVTHNVGDLWFDTSNGDRLNQWNGSAWVAFQYGTGAIASGAITAALIAANTIVAGNIAAGAIGTTQLAANAVTAAKIAANTITAAQIAANTITATQIAAGAITTTQLAANAVTAAKIAANTITASQLAAGIIYAGIVDGTTITGAQIVADGTSGEILVYSSTPAAGNLIASISGAAGTDSFGNTYLAGITEYDNTTGVALNVLNGLITIGTQAHINSGLGATVASVPSSGGILTLDSGKQSAGDTDCQVQIKSATTSPSSQPQTEILGQLLVDDPATFTEGFSWGSVGGDPLATAATDPSGYPTFADNAGLLLNWSGSKLANPAASGPFPIQDTGTAQTVLGFMTVPANDVESGTTYQIHASGSFSTGTSVPSSATFRVFWGGLGGTQITSLSVPTLNPSLTGPGWFLDAEINFVSTTECEVTLRVGWHTASGVAGSVVWFSVNETSGLTTTSSENLSLSFQWGSAPTGTNFLCDVFRAGRVA